MNGFKNLLIYQLRWYILPQITQIAQMGCTFSVEFV
jgi:hypothetical protein